MATKQETIDDLLDRFGGAGNVTAKKMFGEYCLYLDNKPIGLVCDDRLYVKPTDAGRELVPDAPEGPPYPGAKPHFMFPPEQWKDGKALCRLLKATFDALPRPKPKKRKPSK